MTFFLKLFLFIAVSKFPLKNPWKVHELWNKSQDNKIDFKYQSNSFANPTKYFIRFSEKKNLSQHSKKLRSIKKFPTAFRCITLSNRFIFNIPNGICYVKMICSVRWLVLTESFVCLAMIEKHNLMYLFRSPTRKKGLKQE